VLKYQPTIIEFRDCFVGNQSYSETVNYPGNFNLFFHLADCYTGWATCTYQKTNDGRFSQKTGVEGRDEIWIRSGTESTANWTTSKLERTR